MRFWLCPQGETLLSVRLKSLVYLKSITPDQKNETRFYSVNKKRVFNVTSISTRKKKKLVSHISKSLRSVIRSTVTIRNKSKTLQSTGILQYRTHPMS